MNTYKHNPTYTGQYEYKLVPTVGIDKTPYTVSGTIEGNRDRVLQVLAQHVRAHLHRDNDTNDIINALRESGGSVYCIAGSYFAINPTKPTLAEIAACAESLERAMIRVTNVGYADADNNRVSDHVMRVAFMDFAVNALVARVKTITRVKDAEEMLDTVYGLRDATVWLHRETPTGILLTDNIDHLINDLSADAATLAHMLNAYNE